MDLQKLGVRTMAIGVALIFSTLVEGSAAGEIGPAKTDSLGSNAYLAVEFANTLDGTQALYAVRACVLEDRPGDRDDKSSPSQPPVAIHEALTGTSDDVIVRVIDRDGREISSHRGAHDVCGYARISAAFITAVNHAPIEATK